MAVPLSTAQRARRFERLSMKCARGIAVGARAAAFLSRVRLTVRVASLEETWERKLEERSYIPAAQSGESWKFLVAVVFYIPPRFHF